MGQSSVPAKCACGTSGPQRGPAALEVGWVRTRTGWACPSCVLEARQQREAQITEARRAQMAEREEYEKRVAANPAPPRERDDSDATTALTALILLSGMGRGLRARSRR